MGFARTMLCADEISFTRFDRRSKCSGRCQKGIEVNDVMRDEIRKAVRNSGERNGRAELCHSGRTRRKRNGVVTERSRGDEEDPERGKDLREEVVSFLSGTAANLRRWGRKSCGAAVRKFGIRRERGGGGRVKRFDRDVRRKVIRPFALELVEN
ncbi:hypothetical protein R1flu_015845 [Riccia fluitans]|uniref:Uncharacterized protein n=1 Tax=Riccia fluitans TaxID=41844 RepID=A0ABD1YK50_9MARC